MEPAWLTLPKFDLLGLHSVAAPELGTFDVAAGKTLGHFRQPTEKNLPAFNFGTLFARPRAQLALSWTFRKVGVGFSIADPFDSALDMDLTMKPMPNERERREPGGIERSTLRR